MTTHAAVDKELVNTSRDQAEEQQHCHEDLKCLRLKVCLTCR